MRTTAKASFGAVAVAGLALALSGCNMSQQSGPDPSVAQMRPVQVRGAYQLPDGFRNVVEFCDDGGNMLAVTSRGSDLAGGSNGGGLSSAVALVKAEDPRCTGAKR